MSYLVVAVLSAAVGGVGTYLAARKFPRAFGIVVAAVNKVDDAVNQAVADVKK